MTADQGSRPRARARRAASGARASRPALLLALALAGAAASSPSAAAAQWRTQDGGLWGARRCQSRNLLSAGLLLSSSGLPLLSREDQVGAGVGLMLAGSAVAITGLGLRVRLRRDPGRDGPHDRWPEDRCQARSLSIRGGVYLVTAIMAMVRLIRLPDESATAGARAVAALVAVLPPALVGLVFTVLGLRRLRQLGPRPAESSPALLGGGLADPAADAPALMLAYPITF